MMDFELTSTFAGPHGRIRHGRTGSGQPVVLCHGTPTSSFIWRDAIPVLAERYEVHYFDLHGYGSAEMREGQDVRLRALAQSLAALVRHLGLRRPHLVGHDFGAATVLGAHLVEELEAASLTIADGVVLSPWGTAFSRLVKTNEQTFAQVPSYVHRAMLRAHLRTATRQLQSREVLDRLVEPWTSEVGQRAYYRQVGQYDYDYTERLELLYPRIKVPTTVIWGAEDGWVPISEGRRFAAMISHAKFVPIEDAGHFSMLDVPNTFAAAVLSAIKVAQDG